MSGMASSPMARTTTAGATVPVVAAVLSMGAAATGTARVFVTAGVVTAAPAAALAAAPAFAATAGEFTAIPMAEPFAAAPALAATAGVAVAAPAAALAAALAAAAASTATAGVATAAALALAAAAALALALAAAAALAVALAAATAAAAAFPLFAVVTIEDRISVQCQGCRGNVCSPATQPPNGPARAALRQRTRHASPLGPPVQAIPAGISVEKYEILDVKSPEHPKVLTCNEGECCGSGLAARVRARDLSCYGHRNKVLSRGVR